MENRIKRGIELLNQIAADELGLRAERPRSQRRPMTPFRKEFLRRRKEKLALKKARKEGLR